MGNENRRFNRILRKYNFLINEIEDISEMHVGATSEFMMEVSKAKGYKPEKIDPIKKENEDNDGDNSKEDKENEMKKRVTMEPKYKKLYRQLAIASHPDKADKDMSEKEIKYLTEIYHSCAEAYEDGDEATLISKAVEIGLDVTEFEEDFIEIEDACKKLEESINKIQGTSAWYYKYVLKTDKERDDFIKKFVEYTDRPPIEKDNKKEDSSSKE